MVVARKKGTRDPWKVVSAPFQMESSAKEYVDLYMRSHPEDDAYVSSRIKREDRGESL
jgi:hypothetical protein